MHKKILSLVLTAFIILSSVAVPVQAKELFPYDSLIFGEDQGDAGSAEGDGSENAENAEKFLYEMELKTVVGLRWMSEIEAGKYNPTELVSKRDVYESLINMIKGPDVEKTIDVSGDNVTFEEVADIFIKNLSLNPYIPKGTTFFAAGSMAGLFKGMKGITKDAYVNREQLAKILYNSLKIKQYEANIGKTPIAYEEGATVQENIELQIIEGVITADEYIDFYSSTPLEEGYVAINRMPVKNGTPGKQPLLGKKVTAYLAEVDDELTLLYAYEEESNPKSDVKITTDDYISSTSTTLQYYEGSKNKKANLNPNARVLYNGRYLGQLTSVNLASYATNEGIIQTIDMTEDDRADLVIITSFATWHVESAYTVEDDFIITSTINSSTLQYDENATYYFVKNGELVAASDIKPGMILYVAESLGTTDKLYMIYISEEKIDGTITGVGDGTIVVDGKTYKRSKNFTEAVDYRAATIYLGYDGKVAHIVYTKESDMQYGYIMSLTCNTEESDDGVMFMRVFTMDGKETKYESAEKIWFQNGRSDVTSTIADLTIEVPKVKRTPKYVYDALVAQGKYQVVQFGLDTEGKISKLATAVDATESGRIYENVFSKDFASADRIRFYNKYLGPRFKRSAKMNYMVVPAAEERKGDIKYYSVKAVPTDQSMTNLEFYDATANGDVAGGLIVRYVDSASASLTGSCGAGIVKEVSLVYDEVEGGVNYQVTIISREGEEVNAIVSQDNDNMINTGRTTENAALKASELRKGDIILYATDSLGALTAFNCELRAAVPTATKYEKGDESVSQTSNLVAILTAFTEVLGAETKSNGDVIFSANTGLNTVTVNGNPVPNPLWNRSYNVPKARKVLIYDSATGDVTVGSGKDIVKGDKIFIQTNYDYIRQTYIIVR